MVVIRYIMFALFLGNVLACKPVNRVGNAKVAQLSFDSKPYKETDPPTLDWGIAKVSEHGSIGKLILVLDHMPAGSGVLPQCMNPLAAGTVIGLLSCESSRASVPLKTDHVFQECYTGQGVPVIEPSERLLLPQCKSARVEGYDRFEPRFRIDIEEG